MIDFILLAVLSAAQNAAFTWVSRSRNSGDANYHRYAAWCSNGIYFVTNAVILKILADAWTTGEWWRIALGFAVYVGACSEGSVAMMKYLLKRETGKKRVGSY